MSLRKRFEAIATSLVLITIIALALRVTMTRNYIRLYPRHALAVLPFHFEAGNIAYSIAAGRGFSSPFLVLTGPTAWMPPIYPYLLAGILHVFGVYTFLSFLAAVGLNIFFSVLTCVPIFYIGKQIGGLRLGALAAWLWAIFPNANLLTFEALWDASIDAFLCAAILWATLGLEEKPRRIYHWCGYGLLWGVTLMTNAALATLLPFFLGWIAYRYSRRGYAWVRQVALTLAMIILCCVPWTIRNYEVFDAVVPIRSIMGLQLWLGNNAETTPIWLGHHHPIFDQHERDKYTEMGEIAYMQEKRILALQFAEENPGRVVELTWRRFLTVWSGGTAFPIRDLLSVHDLWFRYVLLFNLIAATGTVAGIAILWRSQIGYAFPVAIGPLVYPWPYYLTIVEPRYRLPIDPIVLLLLAVTLLQLSGSIRSLISKGPSPALKGRTS